MVLILKLKVIYFLYSSHLIESIKKKLYLFMYRVIALIISCARMMLQCFILKKIKLLLNQTDGSLQIMIAYNVVIIFSVPQ